MSALNPELAITLDDAVEEVLGVLTGLDLSYDPRQDRYQAVTRCLNRALRGNALEHEWSYYYSISTIGTALDGMREVLLPARLRPRVVGDDAVRLVDAEGVTRVWAYFLPPDAVEKYQDRQGLWAAAVRNWLKFSRPLHAGEAGLEIQVPVMREPSMFRLPRQPEDPALPLVEVPVEVRTQPVDFSYPDVVITRAAWLYSLTDPVMQPRAQTLEAMYKDLMYQAIERDKRATDSPYSNEFVLAVQPGLRSPSVSQHLHPHAADGR